MLPENGVYHKNSESINIISNTETGRYEEMNRVECEGDSKS